MPWSQVIDRRSAWWQLAEPGLERVVEGVAVALGQVQQTGRAGLALDERADRGLLVLADDQIALPVPGLAAVLGRERPLVDRAHRLLRTGVGAGRCVAGRDGDRGRCAAVSDAAAPAVTGASAGSGLVDGLVDALVTQPDRRVAGNRWRRWRLICCGLQRCDNSSPITRRSSTLTSTRRR